MADQSLQIREVSLDIQLTDPLQKTLGAAMASLLQGQHKGSSIILSSLTRKAQSILILQEVS